MNSYRDLVKKLEDIDKKYTAMSEGSAAAEGKISQLRQLQSELIHAILQDTEQNQQKNGSNWNQQSTLRSKSVNESISKLLIESFGYDLYEVTGGMNMANLATSASPQAAPVAPVVPAAPASGMNMANLATSSTPPPPPPTSTPSILNIAKRAGGKLVPAIGAGLSAEDAYERASKGDWTGAGIAGLAGAAYLAPGLGWLVGTALDIANAARDFFNGDEEQGASAQPLTQRDSIIQIQKELQSKGADLGRTGPNHDGIDGILGRKTRAAMGKFGIQQPTVAESIRQLQQTLKMIEDQEEPSQIDPELERLSIEASAKGLLVVNKNDQIYLVYPPSQLVFNQQGQQVDPTTLTVLPNQIDLNEGFIGGLAKLFSIAKNFSSNVVKKGITAIKKNPAKTAGVGAGATAGYVGNDLAGNHSDGGSGITSSNSGNSKNSNNTPDAVNILPPGQNPKVQEIVRKMKALMSDMNTLNDPSANGAVFDAQKQISQVVGLPADLSIPLIPNWQGYSSASGQSAQSNTTAASSLQNTSSSAPQSGVDASSQAGLDQQLSALAKAQSDNDASMSPQRKEFERRKTMDRWDTTQYGKPSGVY
jgi:hypothetical protein